MKQPKSVNGTPCFRGFRDAKLEGVFETLLGGQHPAQGRRAGADLGSCPPE